LNITPDNKTEIHLRHPSYLLGGYTDSHESRLILYILAENNTNFLKINMLKNKTKLTWQKASLLIAFYSSSYLAPCVSGWKLGRVKQRCSLLGARRW